MVRASILTRNTGVINRTESQPAITLLRPSLFHYSHISVMVFLIGVRPTKHPIAWTSRDVFFNMNIV